MLCIRFHEAVKLLLLLCFSAHELCQIWIENTQEAQFDIAVVEVRLKARLSAQQD